MRGNTNCRTRNPHNRLAVSYRVIPPPSLKISTSVHAYEKHEAKKRVARLELMIQGLVNIANEIVIKLTGFIWFRGQQLIR